MQGDSAPAVSGRSLACFASWEDNGTNRVLTVGGATGMRRELTAELSPEGELTGTNLAPGGRQGGEEIGINFAPGGNVLMGTSFIVVVVFATVFLGGPGMTVSNLDGVVVTEGVILEGLSLIHI